MRGRGSEVASSGQNRSGYRGDNSSSDTGRREPRAGRNSRGDNPFPIEGRREPRVGRVYWLVVVLLLAAFAVQVLPPLFEKSSVCDEHGAHLPSGYVYWKTGVFSGGINNPPLMQLVCAAPLALAGLDYSPFSDEGIWAARLPVLLISLALALVVFAWAKSLYGRAAGIAGLFLFCFEPNVLAHSGLATLDLGVAAFTFAAFFFLWRTFLSRRTSNWVAACVLMSLALLSKFTALFLLPVFILFTLVALCRGGSVGYRVGRGVVALAFFGLFFIGISHALYHAPAISHTPHLPDEPGERSAVIVDPSGSGEAAATHSAMGDRAAVPAATSDPAVVRAAQVFLPDLYVNGALGKLRHSAGGHFAYLMGKRSLGGWWYYFPVALALKTPIPFLAAFCLALAFGAGLRRERPGLSHRGAGYAFLLLPMACYIFAMAWTGVNIGVRHVLLFYPVAAVAGSVLLAAGSRRSGFLVAVLVLGGAWHLSGAVAIHPHYLAYFNGVAGGPMGGPQYLIDSNIDWGQDENLLAQFIAEKPESVLVNPGPYVPSVGTIVVNVNSLKGILKGDDTAYEWLRQFEPEMSLGNSWYVYRLAAEDFGHAARDAEPNMESRFWYAIVLQKEGRLEEGLFELRSIAKHSPDLAVRAWLISGRWLVEARRHAEAIEVLSKAVEVGGGGGAQVSLEAALVDQKWDRGAAEAEELSWLGQYHAEGGRPGLASEAFEAALALTPDDPSLDMAMARLLARGGAFEDAAVHAEKAVGLAPESVQAGQIAEEARRLVAMQDLVRSQPSGDETGGHVAMNQLEELSKLDELFEAHMTLARIHGSYGRPDAAARHYWSAFSLNPSSQEALTAMGDIVVRVKLGALKLETEWPPWEPQ